MKTQTNIRTSNLTRQQLAELAELLSETQTGIVAKAVDRMWHEEIPMARRKTQTVEANDLIAVGPGSNTHGCRDYAILRYNGNGKAVVIEAQSCTSCWQVGHDSDHTFATVGDVWNVTADELTPAGNDWRADVKWEM